MLYIYALVFVPWTYELCVISYKFTLLFLLDERVEATHDTHEKASTIQVSAISAATNEHHAGATGAADYTLPVSHDGFEEERF